MRYLTLRSSGVEDGVLGQLRLVRLPPRPRRWHLLSKLAGGKEARIARGAARERERDKRRANESDLLRGVHGTHA